VVLCPSNSVRLRRSVRRCVGVGVRVPGPSSATSAWTYPLSRR